MTTAQKSRTLTRQASHFGEVRFDGAVCVDAIYGSPGGLARVINQKITIVVGRAISMPMRREIRRQIEGDVWAWAQRAGLRGCAANRGGGLTMTHARRGRPDHFQAMRPICTEHGTIWGFVPDDWQIARDTTLKHISAYRPCCQNPRTGDQSAGRACAPPPTPRQPLSKQRSLVYEQIGTPCPPADVASRSDRVAAGAAPAAALRHRPRAPRPL